MVALDVDIRFIIPNNFKTIRLKWFITFDYFD